MDQYILELASELIKIPSRAGIDPNENILRYLCSWMAQNQIECQMLQAQDCRQVGLFIHIESGRSGPVLCLNACVDTAPFGDERAWKHSPTSGIVEDGRLYGRGAADSKIAVSIFSHLAARLLKTGELMQGGLFIVFDADEHSGEFTGIKRFLEVTPKTPEAVIIGYPGNQKLVIGSRGFLRADLNVYGEAAHTGSKSVRGFNAIEKSARLIDALYSSRLPREAHPEFTFGPEVNVTEIRGGEGFSVIPDLCSIKVDIRLTPNINRSVAAPWLESVVKGIDTIYPGKKTTDITWLESWPAYCNSRQSVLVTEFLAAAEGIFNRPVEPVVSGPSNIGNYLASKDIPALSGFGVTYENLHGTDEFCEIDSIGPVFETYLQAVKRLSSAETPLNKDSLIGE